MQRYRLTLSYDGSLYAGWQVQPNGGSVQAKVESALELMTGEKVKVHGCGRTDQGVHAHRYTAHFDMTRPFSDYSLIKGLNGILPPDIRALRVRKVPESFHARHSVKMKEYRYFIWTGKVMPPMLRFYRTHIPKPLDVIAMQKAADTLVGRHDFSAFSANPNRPIDSAVRTVYSLNVRKHGHEITIIARGEGFLYKMVRSLAGFLVRVGEGAVSPDEAQRILVSRKRTARVPTAPPQGLFLWNTRY